MFNIFTASSNSDSLSFVIVTIASDSARDTNFDYRNLHGIDSKERRSKKTKLNILLIEIFNFK